MLTQGVQLTFHLLPFNYFDEDVSLASRDNIRVTPGQDGGMVYKYSGVEEDVECVPRPAALMTSASTGSNASKMPPALGWIVCSVFITIAF